MSPTQIKDLLSQVYEGYLKRCIKEYLNISKVCFIVCLFRGDGGSFSNIILKNKASRFGV